MQQAVDALGFQQAPDDVTIGGTTNINLLVSMNTEDGRGNITAYLGYRDINSILQSQYDFSACALQDDEDPNAVLRGGSLTKFPTFVSPFDGVN